MKSLPCCFGWHKWRRVEDRLGYYGMGSEWFECYECERCPAVADQLRGPSHWRSNYRHSWQVHNHGYQYPKPHRHS